MLSRAKKRNQKITRTSETFHHPHTPIDTASFDHVHTSTSFCDNISNGSEVTVLTNTETDTTENNTTLAVSSF